MLQFELNTRTLIDVHGNRIVAIPSLLLLHRIVCLKVVRWVLSSVILVEVELLGFGWMAVCGFGYGEIGPLDG